jgi:hypothetical protein
MHMSHYSVHSYIIIMAEKKREDLPSRTGNRFKDGKVFNLEGESTTSPICSITNLTGGTDSEALRHFFLTFSFTQDPSTGLAPFVHPLPPLSTIQLPRIAWIPLVPLALFRTALIVVLGVLFVIFEGSGLVFSVSKQLVHFLCLTLFPFWQFMCVRVCVCIYRSIDNKSILI